MTTSDDRPPPAQPSRQTSQSPVERRSRPRRELLFTPEDDAGISLGHRQPPAPLGDLIADIDQDLPVKAGPGRPPREQPRPEHSHMCASPRPGLAPTGPDQAPAPRPDSPVVAVATKQRSAPSGQLPRISSLDDLVAAESQPLLDARARFDDIRGDLDFVEHRFAARGLLDFGGYFASSPPAPILGRWVWVGVVIVASVLILVTMGGGDGGISYSRWKDLMSGGGSASQSRGLLFSGQARPAGDYTLRAAPSITPEMIDRVLASYGSPAAGTGAIWYNLGLEYGIDPVFPVAFFIMESTAGTAQGWAGLKPDGSTTHNVGNIICAGYASCYGRFRDYSSWAEGIEDWYRLIDVEYLSGRGHQTVADIIPVYAPAIENDVQAYITVVQNLVDEWRVRGAP